MHIAAEHGCDSILNFVLQNTKVSLLQRDSNFRTPLHDAASHNQIRSLRLLLNPPHPFPSLTQEPDARDSALHCTHALHAAHQQHYEAASERAIPVDACKRGEWTSLMLAASNGHDQCVCALLDASADPLAVNRDGNTPLQLAAKHGHESTLNILLNTIQNTRPAQNHSNKNNTTSTVHAAIAAAALSAARSERDGSDACVRLILERSFLSASSQSFLIPGPHAIPFPSLMFVLNARGAGDTTLLLELSERAAFDTIAFLLGSLPSSNGTVVMQRDAAGNSALHRAVLAERKDDIEEDTQTRVSAVSHTIEVIVKSIASPHCQRDLLSITDSSGRTAAQLAELRGSKRAARTLWNLQSGATTTSCHDAE
mmetsp:Transcript_17101/g.37182  ORF Transcript_17101/g.37182 Transcript_17101/m.37182 type:complete len:369 (-) Transcript_17101:1069-2175(-)